MSIHDLLQALIAKQSVSPEDAGCQQFMQEYLNQLGFNCTEYNSGPVKNFYAEIGDSDPLLIFAGHTDVVPSGPLAAWDSDPYNLSERSYHYYGRGVADMKGSLACMMWACRQLVASGSPLLGRLGLLITSGDEGSDFLHGTPYVMQQLAANNNLPKYCIVGEPSSTKCLGDVVKNGRRGSLSAQLQIHGVQGHVAYPHLAKNPVHLSAGFIAELTSTIWDDGGEFFPPTSLQITRIHADGGASNVTAPDLNIIFNIRYSILQTAEKLKQRICALLAQHNLQFDVEWTLNGEPFLTSHGDLLQVVAEVIEDKLGYAPKLATSGGTSDGRFIAPYGVELIELGPVNATIHQINEQVKVTDLQSLADVYLAICQRLLT